MFNHPAATPFDRRISKIPQSPGVFKYKIIITSIPVAKNTMESLKIRQALMTAIATDIEFTRHGEVEWDSMSLRYKNDRWEAVCESISEDIASEQGAVHGKTGLTSGKFAIKK